MRLFIALHLPEEVRRALGAVQEQLRAADHPVRWADPQSMHLTLQFLGEAGEDLAAPLVAALAALQVSPIELELGRLGAFPNLREPRVVWASVGGDTDALAQLQAAVLAATAPLGFMPEERAFTPHLTLGRVRQEASLEQIQALGEAVANAPALAIVDWNAGEPALYESTLTPSGAVYRRLGP